MGLPSAGTDQQSHHAAENCRVHQQDAAGESPAARGGPETEGGDPAPQLVNQVRLEKYLDLHLSIVQENPIVYIINRWSQKEMSFVYCYLIFKKDILIQGLGLRQLVEGVTAVTALAPRYT